MLSTDEDALSLKQSDGLSLYDECLVRETVRMLAKRVLSLFSCQTSAAVLNQSVLRMLLKYSEQLPDATN